MTRDRVGNGCEVRLTLKAAEKLGQAARTELNGGGEQPAEILSTPAECPARASPIAATPLSCGHTRAVVVAKHGRHKLTIGIPNGVSPVMYKLRPENTGEEQIGRTSLWQPDSESRFWLG
jgi:hypothetical protein